MYLVPFVEDEHTVFLKKIIPIRQPRSAPQGRKATKEYLGEEIDDEA